MKAEDFLRSKGYDSGEEPTEVIKELLCEFAKLHVQAALEAALEEVPYGSSTDTVSYEDVSGILTCYPLENIK